MTPAPILKDQAAREAIRTALSDSLWVEAAAGTGKTTELVNRIVAVLRTGHASIDQIAAVTFTNKAAGELKLRLRQKLDENRSTAQGAEAANIAMALERLEDASIGTIHSFCAQILRERPVEAGIDPAFVESAEQETRAIFARAFRTWFERALEQNPPGLRRALARLAWADNGSESASERLQSAAWALVTWRDFPAPWTRPPFDRDVEAASVLDTIRAIADGSAALKRDDPAFLGLAPVRELAAWAARPEFAAAPDYDTLEALILALPGKLRDRKFGRAKSQVDDLKNRIEAFKRPADADLAALLQSEMSGVCEIYDDLKAKAGRLDFQDLLMRVRNLVRDNRQVREWLQSRFGCIYVDEFQDTDPLQAEILLLLAAGNPAESDWRKAVPTPGKFFAVGDPKQSIYKFRRADAQLYNDIRDRLEKAGVRRVELTSSFRAVAPIQDCINAAFSPEIVEDPHAGQAKYVPLDKVRQPIGTQPSVIALPVPHPYGFRNVSQKAIEASLPDAIAAFVEWLLPQHHEKRWRVCDPETGELRAMKGSDIAILFRKTSDFYAGDLTRPLVRSLEARGIAHLLVGSKSFYEREEVTTLRTACEAIEWPDDELSIYATLHGALFAINDEILLRYRHDHGRLHPLAPRDGAAIHEDFQPVAEALDILARLHRRRNRRAIADTLSDLLDTTRAHIGFAIRPGGHHVLGNVYRVIDVARSFELEGGVSFRGFVEELAARASRPDSAEAPMVEEAAEGVRILTVHGAKGLEFPVVILADLNTGISSRNPERFLDPDRNLCAVRLLGCAPQDLLDNVGLERDRERAEGIRVTYVAATRARDVLVVPVVGDEEREGWVSPLNKALYPHAQHKRWSSVPAGCPPFAGRSVLDRPVQASGDDISVKPGGHKPKVGSHEVVWWDPATLRLNAEETTGLPNADMLKGDPEPGLSAYKEWESARAAALNAAAQPSHAILSPSEAIDAPPGDPIPVESVLCPRDPARPSGRRFGVLVHQLLRGALDGTAGLAAAARSHGRVVGAAAEEIAAAVQAVEAALQHDIIARARQAPVCHRELPVSYRLEDGRIIEGNIDLAFEDNGEWVVVDFKTDADFGSLQQLYESQVRWYAYALSRITNRPARCVLLGV